MAETKGLPNCGNTCYFNSFLQLFFNIKDIQDYFYEYNVINIDTIANEEKNLIFILNKNNQPVIIIYEQQDNIYPSKQINYDFDKYIQDRKQNIIQSMIQDVLFNDDIKQQKLDSLKTLINRHFTRLENLVNVY
jgi:ubiquitin C-terminal hydrolase